MQNQAYENILARLDNLEGFVPDRPRDSTYRRVRRDVLTSKGRTAVSWVYVGHMDQLGDSQLISGGDWVAYAAGKQSETAAWWESVNTVFGRHGNLKSEGE